MSKEVNEKKLLKEKAKMEKRHEKEILKAKKEQEKKDRALEKELAKVGKLEKKGRVHKRSEILFKRPKFNNLKEMLENTYEKYGDCDAFKFKTDKEGVFRTIKYKDYIDEINALGTALISIGLKDKRIGVISENRYEWEEAYLAVTCGTGIIVPLDRALTEVEILSLIERSEMEAIFYSSKYEDTIKKAKEEKIGKVKFFISMDREETDGDFYSQKELIKVGKDLIKNGARSFLDAKIDNEVMTIMLFTSGTTSQSKAVELSQKNICTNLFDIQSTFDYSEKDLFLSFLPLHHTFECTVGFLAPFAGGACIAFCDGVRHIADNLREYEVTVMVSVPVLFEMMFKQVMKQIEKQGKTQVVILGRKMGNILEAIGIHGRKEIFKDIHKKLGGKIRFFVAGGAAFDPKVEQAFNEMGIACYQGYGLTETSPVIAAEHLKTVKYGSIGRLFPSVDGKIINPDEQGIGELAVKADSVMLGYHNEPEKTKESFTEDGWFLTGDLAYFDTKDFIHITGRKKNVIVLQNGKNIYPEELETLLNELPGVKESFVYGAPDDGDLKISAEIVMDMEKMPKEYGVKTLEEAEPLVWEKVKEVNKTMPVYKYIKAITLTDQELIKTTTLKIKRHEEIKKLIK